MGLDFEICLLAGGLSSRMGRDKSRLVLGGVSLADRILAAARSLGAPVRTVRKDIVPRCGPMGGVLTGLAKTKRSAVLFLSCDMPFVTPELMGELLKLHFGENAPNRPSRLEPLNRPNTLPTPLGEGPVDGRGKAVFAEGPEGKGFPFVLGVSELPTVRRLIAEKRFSLQNLAKIIAAERLVVPKSRIHELFNINTPGDFGRAAQLRQELCARAQRPLPMLKTKQTAPILEATNLRVRRGGTTILDGVSWRVEKGRHWVILGANGSGKTSLLSALTGYLTPTAGTITLLGRQFGRADWRELRKKIGLVSSSIRQLMADGEPALETVASGKTAMIDMWGRISQADRRRARSLLKQVDCGHLEDRPWLYLSQGERQRVLIGRALMAKPSVLILDEPCAGLDPAAREHFLQFIERLGSAKRGPTLVLVTHHVEEIMPVFSDVLMLKAGAVLASGPKEGTLTSEALSEAFGADVTLGASVGRYELRVAPRTKRVM